MRLEKAYLEQFDGESKTIANYGWLPVGDVKAQTKGFRANFEYAKIGVVGFFRSKSHYAYFATDFTNEELEQLGYKK